MQGAVDEPETEVSAMDRPPAVSRPIPNHVVERKLGELEACLAVALTSRPRRFDVDGSLFKEIQARTDFLRTLIGAEGECHGGARPEHLAEAEERFSVLERTFEQWAQRGVPDAVIEKEEPDEAVDGSGSAGCSCTDSCFRVEFTGPEIESTFDAKCNLDREAWEADKADAVEVTPTIGRTTARRWWKRRTALFGAAGAVAAIALGAGLALELAAVACQTVHLVPT